jgi:gliding motility-associated lipoprotein GldD
MKLFITILCITICVACNEGFRPKPKQYTQIALPKAHQYQQFTQPNFPYSFEYPVYATTVQDSTFFDNNRPDNNWINIDYTKYNCKIFLSYSDVNGVSVYKKKLPNGQYVDSVGKNSFEKLVKDAFNLTSKHDIKSSGKEDKLFKTDQGSGGVYFYVSGQVASPIQFFITDTVKNFVRGALYYDASPNTDSTAPITKFIEEDINHLIKTFKWTNK